MDDEALTAKQKAVLELLLEHKSSKEIARALGISPYTVDQRIAFARKKFGANSRAELARAYSRTRNICGESIYGLSYVADSKLAGQIDDQAEPADPIFTLADATPVHFEVPWQERSISLVGLELLDRRFGILGRIAAILGLAAVIAMLLLTLAAVAEILTRLI